MGGAVLEGGILTAEQIIGTLSFVVFLGVLCLL